MKTTHYRLKKVKKPRVSHILSKKLNKSFYQTSRKLRGTNIYLTIDKFFSSEIKNIYSRYNQNTMNEIRSQCFGEK